MAAVMLHEDAIKFFRSKGIPVSRITRTRVYFEERSRILKMSPFSQHLNPAVIEAVDINEVPDSDERGLYYSIQESAKNNHKITAIRTLRKLSGIGLKDAKDIIDHNWDNLRISEK